jgi:hypothetical protein
MKNVGELLKKERLDEMKNVGELLKKERLDNSILKKILIFISRVTRQNE